jgi:hypothetical protein
LTVLLFICAMFSPATAWADINWSQVHNTGSGGLSGGATDPYWSLVASATYLNPLLPSSPVSMYVTPQSSFPFPNWYTDSSQLQGSGDVSQWISAAVYSQGDAAGNNSLAGTLGTPAPGEYSQPEGYYVYQTTFNATGPGGQSLSGIWASDNEGVAILLNGNPVLQGNPYLNAAQNFLGPPFSTFAIDSNYLVQGTNTLDFVVYNDPQDSGNPSGIRVQFTPEPGSYGVLCLGLSALAVSIQRKRRAS